MSVLVTQNNADSLARYLNEYAQLKRALAELDSTECLTVIMRQAVSERQIDWENKEHVRHGGSKTVGYDGIAAAIKVALEHRLESVKRQLRWCGAEVVD